jgi:hypothetical protein
MPTCNSVQVLADAHCYAVTVHVRCAVAAAAAAAIQIKTDLIIARSANEGDMRYNLDLSHAEDLPINSLGRRVRTRLYFTSEVYTTLYITL